MQVLEELGELGRVGRAVVVGRRGLLVVGHVRACTCGGENVTNGQVEFGLAAAKGAFDLLIRRKPARGLGAHHHRPHHARRGGAGARTLTACAVRRKYANDGPPPGTLMQRGQPMVWSQEWLASKAAAAAAEHLILEHC